jgi:hypothetical protein
VTTLNEIKPPRQLPEGLETDLEVLGEWLSQNATGTPHPKTQLFLATVALFYTQARLEGVRGPRYELAALAEIKLTRAQVWIDLARDAGMLSREIEGRTGLAHGEITDKALEILL